MKDTKQCKGQENKPDCNGKKQSKPQISPCTGKSMDSNSSSLNSLVVWNISKAQEKNPNINLQSELENVKKRLESRAFRDIAALANVTPLERHLVCALLAWQTLGNNDITSLIQFVELKKQEKEEASKKKSSCCKAFPTMGPVVTLPVDIVKPCCLGKRNLIEPAHSLKMFDTACCLDSEYAIRLEQASNQTNELQVRTSRLAEREAHRVELLERAELAWHNLELGFLRKLQLAEDKEHLLAKKLKETEEEYQKSEDILKELVEDLSDKTTKFEKERAETVKVEDMLCTVSCTRHRLEEEASKKANALADQQCKFLKIERDLMFKEDLSKSRVASLKSDLESAKLLTLEAERVIYNELLDIKNQTDQISGELLAIDSRNREDVDQLDSLERERTILEADVLECKSRCDSHMEAEMDKLRALREEMNSLREHVLECRCKLPVDVAVEVKRTPSLVITCDCTNGSPDEIVECSCTSLRHKLLSDLLSDLFGGLQDELSRNGCVMPCEILKCLDDKHNWERNSPIKSSLRNYFSNLLIGELDIAIATSIEKYHAKWVGLCCKDFPKIYSDCGCKCSDDPSYEHNNVEKFVERRAQELIEKIFTEQASKYARETKMTSTSNIIDTIHSMDKNKKVFTCQAQNPKGIFNNVDKAPAVRRNDFGAQKQLQLEEYFKIKSSTKTVEISNEKSNMKKNRPGTNMEILNADNKKKTKDINNKSKLKREFLHSNHKFNLFNNNMKSNVKKYPIEPFVPKKNYLSGQTKHLNNKKNKSNATYSVQMCYETTREIEAPEIVCEEMCLCKPKDMSDILSNCQSRHSSISKLKFLNNLQNSDTIKSKSTYKVPCKCLHTKPSNTSLNKLLDTLGKWQLDLKNKVSTKCTQKNYSNPEVSSVKKSIDTQYEDLTPESKKNYSTNSFITATEMNEVSNNKTKIKSTFELISDQDKINDCKQVKIKTEKSSKYFSEIKTPIESKESEDVQGTESEYMGEINLDKSNETQCMCEQHQEKKMYGSCAKYRFKCINSNACHCEYSSNDKNPTIFSEIDKYLTGSSVEKAANTELCDQNLSILKMNKNTSAIKQTIVDQKQQQQQTVEDIIKKSVLFPQNCDYDINFLGATLTNEKQSKSLKTSFKKYSKNNIVTYSDIKSGSNINRRLRQNHSANDTEKKQDLEGRSIDNRFEDLKEYFNNVLTTYGKNQSQNKDQALDVPSLRTMNVHQQSTDICICCDDTEEVDLEINAFELLREHLKCKLKDLKNSPMKLQNIPKEEEEKLFSCILQKVKEFITESTTMSCKHEEEFLIGNSGRAYELLKEYLETKLRRAKDGCVTKTIRGEVNYNVPELLDKVSHLIENDFEVLKLQKLRKKDNTSMFEIPEKDINDKKVTPQPVYEKNLNEKVVNHVSNETDNFDCGNTSCQVSLFNVTMKSKSCEALDLNDLLYENRDTKHAFNYNLMKETTHNINSQPKEDIKNSSDIDNDNCTSPRSCNTSLSRGQCYCIKSLLKGNYSYVESLDYKKNLAADKDKPVIYEKSNKNDVNSNSRTLNLLTSDNESDVKEIKSSKRLNYSESNVKNMKKVLKLENEKDVKEIKSQFFVNAQNGITPIPSNTIYPEDVDNFLQIVDSENIKSRSQNTSKVASLNNNCDCELVPVCHVKMLVDNIENKLAQSKCMCDLFCAKFCPVHNSKKTY